MRQNVKPTQEPVPSSDIKDLFFNSGLLDIWATSLERKYIDRFGNCHLTAAGMEWLFKELVEKFKVDMNTAIVAAGYITIDSFQQGADLPNNELTLRNHTLRDEATGEYYRWDGDLPKQVPAGSTPQSTGGVGKGAWVSVGDASLRGDLGKITKTYKNVSEMIHGDSAEGDIVRTISYRSGNVGGGYYIILSYEDYNGEPDQCGDHLLANGNIAKLITANNAFEITQLGIVLDGVTVNKLAPVGHYANKYSLNVIVNNTKESECLFDDTINIINSRIISTGFYAKYVGGDIDYKPVFSIGTASLDNYGPARFSTAGWGNYLVGEVVQFSNGGFGHVLFKMDGWVYFKWFSNGGAAFPKKGDVATGVKSGFSGGIREGVRNQVFGRANVNAGIGDLYLTTHIKQDSANAPTSHVKATGVMLNGLSNGGTANGSVGAISVQGFSVGVIGNDCWSLNIKGQWQFNRCENGILQGPECWTATHFPHISFGSIGAKYDANGRYMWMNNYTYSVSVEVLNIGVTYGASPITCSGTSSFHISNADIEFAYVSHPIVFDSPLLVSGNIAARSTEEGKKLRVKSPKFSGRLVESFGVEIRSCVDSPDVSHVVAEYTGSYLVNPTWRTICDTLNSTDCKNIHIASVVSNKVDFSQANPSLTESVTYNRACYKESCFTYAAFVPAEKNAVVVFDQFTPTPKYIELIDFCSSTDVASPPVSLINISNKEATIGNDIDIAYDSDLTFYKNNFNIRFLNTTAIKFRLRNTRSDRDAYYSIACRYRYLQFS
ncbi:hypothetical protein [Providencia manganoxydans]|uniref:tail fiber/spike domain-containing protein n=1 Tax=Providencia manganoxydans TaxID=2923283 RepID=UPI0034E38397